LTHTSAKEDGAELAGSALVVDSEGDLLANQLLAQVLTAQPRPRLHAAGSGNRTTRIGEEDERRGRRRKRGIAQTDRQPDRQTDRQTAIQTDRQPALDSQPVNSVS
jgi:hypothetical protein